MTRENIIGKCRKTVAFMMCTVMLVVSGVINDYTPVHASTESEDHGFEIDETLYNVNWEETEYIKVKQTTYTIHPYFKKGAYLGYAKVYTGYATTKKMVNGKYYQRILVEANMVPQTVRGKDKGMSQYLTIMVENAPKMANLLIQPGSTSGSTSYTAGGSLSIGGNLGYSGGIEGGGEASFGIESSCSYTQGALKVITNVDDNGYARWEYDYVSSTENKEQNAYLFGSSKQRGLFMWNMPKNYNGFYVCLNLKVTATFGGGNVQDNDIIKNFSFSNHLGSASTTKKIIWN